MCQYIKVQEISITIMQVKIKQTLSIMSQQSTYKPTPSSTFDHIIHVASTSIPQKVKCQPQPKKTNLLPNVNLNLKKPNPITQHQWITREYNLPYCYCYMQY